MSKARFRTRPTSPKKYDAELHILHVEEDNNVTLADRLYDCNVLHELFE